MGSYVPSTEEQRREMLKAIGLSDYRELYRDVPVNGEVEVDVRGKRLKAVIPSKHISNNVPPYVVPVIYKQK